MPLPSTSDYARGSVRSHGASVSVAEATNLRESVRFHFFFLVRCRRSPLIIYSSGGGSKVVITVVGMKRAPTRAMLMTYGGCQTKLRLLNAAGSLYIGHASNEHAVY